jgi:hypothetical protein
MHLINGVNSNIISFTNTYAYMMGNLLHVCKYHWLVLFADFFSSFFKCFIHKIYIYKQFIITQVDIHQQYINH